MPSDFVDFAGPIVTRLRQLDTGLRASADPNLLVQSLLDHVTDSALEVVDAFHDKILQLKYDVLMEPGMKVVSSGPLGCSRRSFMGYSGTTRTDMLHCSRLLRKRSKSKGERKLRGNIYLWQADIHDHMEYTLTTMDMFAGITGPQKYQHS
ncbi:uncharacterized protein BJ212DRAFT_727786 [Suillus subaureus]|uniref:Uncharacterized protein n=1 Tax=Suillus subaureus TaxID=48587 RepID=A0A9P7J809_9AGAM|nr:uncharacterized protein BJ212DRAFT_727786 [Suillus subaureus]KAG1807831.1 hypothetical protein BJ212DRAFT_727786 [Suillus subaureus]